LIVIVDTREQRPLSLKCETVRKTLKFGDYGAMVGDYQIPVVFERKGLGDLYGSLTFGYDRLRRVFDRADKAGFKLIIAIEGTKERVLEGYHHSSREPESIIKQLETIHRKYGVEHKFFKNRPEMATFIAEFFAYKETEHLLTR
jgi:ERCC4-type nuclease